MFHAVSFKATLADYETTTFYPGAEVYDDYITAVATAANVDISLVTIVSINSGSVVVSTTVVVPSSQAASFTSKLQSGDVFSPDTFGDVTVSSLHTSGQPSDDQGSGVCHALIMDST